jgi:2'-5' RNA ligase
VLFPFVAPERLDDAVVRRLGAAVRTVSAFDCVFRRTRWFRDEAMWLAPEPDDGFRRLTAAVRAQFPDCAPYEGAHPDPIPHVTVGTTSVGSLEAVRRAEAEVSELLPIRARVERVQLMAGTREPGSWQVLKEFSLTPRRR